MHGGEPEGERAELLMPGGSVSEVLRERARLLSRPPGSDAERAESAPMLLVRVGPAGLYGIPYADIEEIVGVPGITPVPCAPPCFAGIINYRGELLSVFDLRTVFGIAGAGGEAGVRVVVVRDRSALAGLRVDEIVGNDRFAAGALSPFPAGGSLFPGLVTGVHAGRIAILEISCLFAGPSTRFDDGDGA